MRKIIWIWLIFELLIAWMISHWFGVGLLLLSWLAALVAGSYLLRSLGAYVSQWRQGIAGLPMSGPLVRVGAAILLIIPGTLSDIVALLLLFPGNQTRFARKWGGATARAGGFKPHETVIEGEFVEERDTNHRIGPSP
ncbi:MAG: FxsA cytoplasmic rane protein [Pseudomonadota bacterium]|jgi:UPF0716 protein FxsA